MAKPEQKTFRGLLAIELRDAVLPGRPALSNHAAGDVAALLGRDLAKLVPGVTGCDLALLAVHYDPAEALRPGWPIHRLVEELLNRLPDDGFGPRTVGFGADARGEVPAPLRADPEFAGGVLRVMPFVLRGDALAEVEPTLEDELFDRGLAEADVALALIDRLEVKFEHIRYQSLHDLLAMTAMQYQHVGLDDLWSLLDTALLAPQSECVVAKHGEPLARYADGEARIGMLDYAAWQRRDALPDADPQDLARAFTLFEMRQRQYAAVLGAHGVPVQFVHCPEADPRYLG